MRDLYIRRFQPARIVDGDTLYTGVVDLGYGVARWPRVRYRLERVNCPESNRPATRQAGMVAKAFTVDWFAVHGLHNPDGWFYAQTRPEPMGALTDEETDSFGRYLAEVECADGHNLSDALLVSGNAVPFK